jgi:nucleoside 2-deoxyribosyltransferase
MAATKPELLKQREQAMDRADRALDKAWPERKGEEYVREMESAAAALDRIAAQMHAAGSEPLEQSRVYRYLGSVRADLAPALGKQSLMKSRDAYRKAESLLGDHGEPLERAKLDFNFGNTLRQLDPNDVGLLQEAERRFLSARKVFAEQAPQNVASVDEALSSTRNLLKLAPLANTVAKNRADLAGLEEGLKSGENLAGIAARMKEIRERGGGIPGLFAAVQGMVNELPDSARQGEKFAQLKEQMNRLVSLAGRGDAPKEPIEREILQLLRQKLGEEAGAGRVTGERAKTLADLLDGFGKVMASGGDDIASMMSQLQAMRQKAEGQFANLHYLSHGIERPKTGSRAAQLVELCWALRLFILEESFQPGKSDGESKAVFDLNIRASKVDKRIYEAGSDDARASTVEQEALRPLALDIRSFAARHHPMLAQPIWPSARVQVETNAVLFAGSDEVRGRVAGVCRKLGLDLLGMPKGDDVASARWRQLQAANVAVFDLGAAEGPERAAVAYELGIARTLGKSVVVLAGQDQQVPFDVDVEPVLLSGSARDADAVAEAIDRALVWMMPRPRSAAVLETMQEALRRYSASPRDIYVDQTLKELRRLEAEPDAVAATATLSTLVGFLGADAPMLIHPVWTPAYPEPGKRRLFHVMPFRPEWSDAAADRVEKACCKTNAQYVRGDRVADANVIRSIWQEINRASHVLADLTGFNANVALELGIAHALGRPTLTIAQGADFKPFAAIARLRFHLYQSAQGAELGKLVDALLAQ